MHTLHSRGLRPESLEFGAPPLGYTPCRSLPPPPPLWLPPQVKPRKGDALLFWDINPDGSLDQHALHGGCDVVSGQKWAATKWMRNKCMGMDCPKSRTNAQ